MWRSLIKNERGQAMVEMLIVVVLLLMLVFGITEFGRLFYYSLTISNGARAGARLAAVVDMEDEAASDPDYNLKVYMADKIFPGTSASAVAKRTDLVNDNAAGGNISVVYKDFNGNEDLRIPAGLVDITVNYPVPIVAPLMTSILGTTRTVSAHVVMQIE